MALQRVQMLLEPRQRKKLAALARTQGISVAAVTRLAIDKGLEQLMQDDPQTRMRKALDAAATLRDKQRRRNGKPLDIDIVDEIRLMREERSEELFHRGG